MSTSIISKMIMVSELCQHATEKAIDYIELSLLQKVEADIATTSGPSRWMPPAHGPCKMNITCRFRAQSALVGVRVVIRDSHGLVTIASCLNLMVNGGRGTLFKLMPWRFCQVIISLEQSIFGGLKLRWTVKISSD